MYIHSIAFSFINITNMFHKAPSEYSFECLITKFKIPPRKKLLSQRKKYAIHQNALLAFSRETQGLSLALASSQETFTPTEQSLSISGSSLEIIKLAKSLARLSSHSSKYSSKDIIPPPRRAYPFAENSRN